MQVLRRSTKGVFSRGRRSIGVFQELARTAFDRSGSPALTPSSSPEERERREQGVAEFKWERDIVRSAVNTRVDARVGLLSALAPSCLSLSCTIDMRSEGGSAALPRESVTLPGIRSLFPDLWTAPQESRPFVSTARKLPYAHFDAEIAVEPHANAPPLRAALSDAPGCKSMRQYSERRRTLPPISQGATASGTSLVPPVIQLPPGLKSGISRKTTSSNYSLGIMRLHPLTADLEQVASSSSVSTPPRAHFRAGLMPYHQEEATDAHADEILNACAQPAFRVTVPTSLDCTTLETHPDEVDKSRPHRCPQCGKGFNRPSSLVTHVNMHTGAKPHPCLFPGCLRRFNVKSNMRRHYQRHLRPHPPLRTRASSSTSPALPSAWMTPSASRSPSPLARKYLAQMGAVRPMRAPSRLDRPA